MAEDNSKPIGPNRIVPGLFIAIALIIAAGFFYAIFLNEDHSDDEPLGLVTYTITTQNDIELPIGSIPDFTDTAKYYASVVRLGESDIAILKHDECGVTTGTLDYSAWISIDGKVYGKQRAITDCEVVKHGNSEKFTCICHLRESRLPVNSVLAIIRNDSLEGIQRTSTRVLRVE